MVSLRWCGVRGGGNFSVESVGDVAGDLNDFFQARQTFADFAKTVEAEGDHAVGGGDAAQIGHAFAGDNRVAQLVVDNQELMHAKAAAIACIAAFATADTAV